MPQVSAKSWVILDARRNITLWSKNPDQACEVASLTKIMTSYVVITTCQEMEINMETVYCRVSKRASEICGTSAFLKEGLRFSIFDLLHGLMLPSGNDAALVLSEHFGRLFYLTSCKSNSKQFKEAVEMDPYDPETGKLYTRKFCQKMNSVASLLKMTGTNYNNPHGLCDKANKSTASDQARISSIAMKVPILKEIVAKKAHHTLMVF
jgi:D-alanyl-D-alanine carboxypeptidase